MIRDPLTQARDRIAELCGYVCKFDERRYDETWFDGDVLLDAHPIPACLNFVSKVWPSGTPWYEPRELGDNAHDTRVEWHLTSLYMALVSLKANDPPAFAAAIEKIRKECGA